MMDNKNWPHEAPSNGRHSDTNTEPQGHPDPQALGQTLAGEGGEPRESKLGQEIEEKDAQADGPVAETRAADFELPPSPGRAKYFSEHTFVPFKPLDHRIPELYLPIGLVDRLFQQEQDQLSRESEERMARMEAHRKQHEAERERAEQEKKKLEQEQAKAKASASDKAGGPKGNPEAFRLALEKTPKKRRLQVYSLDAVEKLRSTANTADTDVVKRSDAIGRLLIERGPYRRVGIPRSVQTVLDLKQDHPHFTEVIEFVANHVALQRVSSKPVRLPPMLFFGPPGVGKTHFTEALAMAMGVPVRRHPMDQAETSSAFLGSEKTWGNSHYGLVFELLGLGDCANPVVILDELDKAQTMGSSSGRAMSPTTVLHSLLEPVSAAHVRDNSLELELDASLISWIATANYPQLIAPTLRSRLKEFLIMSPCAEQAIQVARSVVRNAIEQSGVNMAEPDKRFILALTPLSPREIYQVVMAAAAKAVASKQCALGLEHLPEDLAEVDAEDGVTERRAQLH
ncbi:AAA family ATPase [Hydrogenophaga sp. YM1]|uniref:AAA family ATPase n=1 Tax=Hydrogenophaga sp. YM1 TaxID=2806262 RepID=UPI001959E2C3|nr:AAA family ATPase [Hydrogenophaga sp. YM1]QRR33992.1 AAA family ATPase [Hydrogenophaga sp. YM1]